MTYIGNEPFLLNGKDTSLTMNDFWRWAYSDLNNDALRSMLAKFIVASSLEITTLGMDSIRDTEKSYDLLSKDGYKIDVRSAAYIQTLDEECPDHISFSITPIMPSGKKTTICKTDILQRNSDAFIFCIFKAQTKDESPLDLDLWDFYILSTKTLNEKRPAMKTITLPSLMQMKPVRCDYYGIEEAIRKILTV